MEINEDTLAALGRKITSAAALSTDDKTRADLFNEYMGEPYGDEVDGRSAFVSSDISDAVESTLPDIIDVFTASENVVTFLPVGAEDEPAAEQETDVVNHVFWKMNPGFLILYTWIKEALTQQNSYVKQGWVDKYRVEIEDFEDLDEQELLSILRDKQGTEYEVLDRSDFQVAQVPNPQTGQVEERIIPETDPKTGQPVPIRIKLRCITREKRYEICNIPQEDFFCTSDWHSISLDGIPVCGHRRKIEVGELLAMGFDEESLKAADEEYEQEQTTERHDTEDSRQYSLSDNDDDWGATRLITVYEAYVRHDMDEDGTAELCKVWAVGDGSQILKWEDGTDAVEEVSDHPFSCITPFIVPHRHVGRSLAELIRDIQRVKTVLMRHGLDSIYATNYARPMFDEMQGNSEQLYQDLMNPDPGAPIRTGGIPIEWTKPPQVVGDILPILGMMDSLAEKRTGSTQYAQGMATEALNNTAASTVAQVRDWVTMRKMLIARTFAETGFKDMFRRIHKDLRSGPHRDLAMKLRNQWVAVNPRQWKTRTDLTVAVGMGTGDRDTIREGMMLLAQTQEKMLAAGMPMVGMQEVRATAEKVMSTYGIEDIPPYIKDPSQIPPEQPKEPEQDPRMAIAMQQMQMQQQKQQQDFELKKYEIDLKHQRELEKLRLDQQKLVLDDDRARDVEELKAATGFQRDNPMRAELGPAIPYSQVTQGPR